MRRFISALRKSWGRPVSLLIVAHGPLPMWRLNFSAPFLLFLTLLWTGTTIWAGYIIGRHVDYQVTKADNKVLHTKIAYVAQEISKEKKYLEMTRKTEIEMRLILGMDVKKPQLSGGGESAGAGGATSSEVLDFKKVLENKANEIKESMFRRTIQQIGEESRNRLASFQEIAWHIANQRTVEGATPSIAPTTGRITSPFGYRLSPFSGEGDYHRGIDIGSEPDTPVVVSADGVVRHSGWAEGYGQAILVDHGFGYSTLYGHLAEIKVKEGDYIRRGQIIARVGTTGRSTGTHLHYEVWRDGSPVSPTKYFKMAELSSPRRARQEKGGSNTTRG